MTKKWEKFTAEKKLNFFFIKLQFTYLSLGLYKDVQFTEEAFSSQKKRKHPALQNMKFLQFFSTLLGHFYRPGSGSGSTDLIESGSNTDPDPKPWLISIWIKIQLFTTMRIRIRK
jgi:hypothetical protein